MQRKVYLDFQDNQGFRDISSLVKYDTLNVTLRAFSENFHYAQNEASFDVIYDPTIYSLLRSTSKDVIVKILDVYDSTLFLALESGGRLKTEDYFYLLTETGGFYPFFYGRISPNKSRVYDGILANTIITLQAEDDTKLLDIPVGDIVYSNYSIMNPLSPSTSIVHQLAYLAGLTSAQVSSDITISTSFAKFAPNNPNDSILDVLSTLLFEYGYTLNFDTNGVLTPIGWINTSTPAYYFTEDNMVQQVQISETARSFYGAEVTYYEIGTLQDALLYMDDNCPYADTGGFSGYTVISGTSYPPTTNVIDSTTGSGTIVYQEYSDTSVKYWTNTAIVKGLDYNYKAFNSDFSSILATDSQWVDAYYDTGIVAETPVFYNTKCKLKYNNPTASGLKLYFNNVYGDVWYKTTERKATVINTTVSGIKIDHYASSFLYTKSDAEYFVKHLAAIYDVGNILYTLIHDVVRTNETPRSVGEVVNISMDDGTDQNCIVSERSYDETTGLYKYKLRSYAADIGVINITRQTTTAAPLMQDLSQVLSSSLTPDNLSVSCDIDGSDPNFADAFTRMNVYKGNADVSPYWTYSAVTAGVTGSFGTGADKNKYTLTGFTADVGTVTITASRTGFASQVKVLNVVKIYQYTTKSIQITGEQVHSYSAGVPTPSYLSLLAVPHGFMPSSYQWQWLASGLWTNMINAGGAIVGATTSGLTMYPTALPWGTSSILRIRHIADNFYTDETELVKVYDGADGTSVMIKGSKPTVGDLPGGATVGDIWVVIADGDGYMWTGSVWQNIGPIQGPVGPAGTTYYLHIRYSAFADGTSFSTTVDVYIGMTVTTSNVAPTDKADYTWSRFEGYQGIPGYTIILDNENHTIVTDVNADPIAGELGISGRAICGIEVYRGTTQLTAVASGTVPSTDQFRYNIGTPVHCTAARKDDSTFYIDTVSDVKGSVPINIYVESASINVLKTMSWNKGTDATVISGVNAIANLAYIDATEAMGILNDSANDALIIPSEKISIAREWAEIVLEYPDMVANASSIGTSTVAYTLAYNNLNLYVNTALTLFTNMSANTDLMLYLALEAGGRLLAENGDFLTIEDARTTWNSIWNTYYVEKVALLTAISSTLNVTKITPAEVPVYAPRYYGKYLDNTPANSIEGDTYTRYSETSGVTNRGVFVRTSGAWTRTEDEKYIKQAMADIAFIIAYKENGIAIYGTAADYTSDSVVQADYAFFHEAFIGFLEAANVHIVASGSIYGGDRYDANGTTVDGTKSGFYIGASGACKVAGIEFEGSQGGGYQWGSPYNVGTSLSIGDIGTCALAALSGSDVVLATAANSQLRRYRWQDGSYTLLSGTLSLSMGIPALCALNDNTVALAGAIIKELRLYSWNGSAWTTPGGAISLGANAQYPSLSAMSNTRVAYYDQSNLQLRVYDWSGSAWSLIGSTTISGANWETSIIAVNSTDVVFTDYVYKQLRMYRWNGGSFDLLGSTTISGLSPMGISALNGTDIAVVNGNTKSLSLYRWSGNDFMQISDTGYSLVGFSQELGLAAINGTELAVADPYSSSLYRIAFPSFLSTPYSRSLIGVH